MIDSILAELRTAENLKNCIIESVLLDSADKKVTVRIITDRAYADGDRLLALKALKKYVPAQFDCDIKMSKLTPDTEW